MKMTIATNGVLLAIILGTTALVEYWENPSSYFKNYEGLKDSGLIEAGWVPNYLPLSSYDINETHNLDTNVVSIEFQFVPGDHERARQNCTTEGEVENGFIFECKEGRLELYKNGKGIFSNSSNGA